MLTQNQIILWHCKHTLKLLGKGGDTMSTEAQDVLVKTMVDTKAGVCPTKTADAIHKLGHSLAQNKFGEIKEEDRGMRKENINKAMDAMRNA